VKQLIINNSGRCCNVISLAILITCILTLIKVAQGAINEDETRNLMTGDNEDTAAINYIAPTGPSSVSSNTEDDTISVFKGSYLAVPESSTTIYLGLLGIAFILRR
jgi:hypothetical protein